MTNRKTPVPQSYPEGEKSTFYRPTPMIPPPELSGYALDEREALLNAWASAAARSGLKAPPAPKFDFPMPPSSTDEWYDVPDIDLLFDSIRLADAMMAEAEDADDSAPESTQRSRIAQVADRCNGGDL